MRNLIRPFLVMSLVLWTTSVSASPDQRLAASSHVLWVLDDGRLVASGDDGSPRGDAGEEPRNHFEVIEGLPPVRAVALSSNDNGAAAVDRDGRVWVWGYGWCRYVHSDCEGREHVPGLVPALEDVKAVALGDDHLLALTTTGSIMALGANHYGQLGAGDADYHPEALAVDGLNDVVQVAAIDDVSLLLRADGTVWGMGSGRSGLLGAAARQLESIYDYPEDDEEITNARPLRVEGLRGIRSIAIGGSFALALDDDGNVWGWGTNGSEQLGFLLERVVRQPIKIAGLRSIVEIAAGYDFTLALRDDGRVLALGGNVYGALGHGRGKLLEGWLRKIKGLRSVAAIYAGHYNAFARLADGRFLGWGTNMFHVTSDPTSIPPTQLDPELKPAPPSAVVAAGGTALWITDELHVDQVTERVEVIVGGKRAGVLEVGPEREEHGFRVELPRGIHPYTLEGEARMEDGRRKVTGSGLIVIADEPPSRRFARAVSDRGLAASIRKLQDELEKAAPGITPSGLQLSSQGPLDEEALAAAERQMGVGLPPSYRQALASTGPFALGAGGSAFPAVALYAPDPKRTLNAWIDRALALKEGTIDDSWTEEVRWFFEVMWPDLDAADKRTLRHSVGRGWIGAISNLGPFIVSADRPGCDHGAASVLWPDDFFNATADYDTGEGRYLWWREEMECDLDVTGRLDEKAQEWLADGYAKAGVVFLTADPDGDPLRVRIERVDDGKGGDDGETLTLLLAGGEWWE